MALQHLRNEHWLQPSCCCWTGQASCTISSLKLTRYVWGLTQTGSISLFFIQVHCRTGWGGCIKIYIQPYLQIKVMMTGVANMCGLASSHHCLLALYRLCKQSCWPPFSSILGCGSDFCEWICKSCLAGTMPQRWLLR